MLLDVKVGAHDPCSLAVLMGRLHGCRSGHSCWRAVFTGSEDRRPRTRPVLRAVLKKKHCHAILANVARGHGYLVHTTRIHGPCWRAVNTAREHGCHFGQSVARAVFTGDAFHARKHGSSRVLWTNAREHGCSNWHPRWRAVLTAREHEYCVPT